MAEEKVDSHKKKQALYRRVFLSPEGSALLTDILRFTNFWTRVTEPGDPISSAFNDGARSVALRILRMVYGPDLKVPDIKDTMEGWENE